MTNEKKYDNIGFWEEPGPNGTTRYTSGKRPAEFGGKAYWFTIYQVESDNPAAPHLRLKWKEAPPRVDGGEKSGAN